MAQKEYANSILEERPKELLRNRTIYVKQHGGIELDEIAQKVELSSEEEEEPQ